MAALTDQGLRRQHALTIQPSNPHFAHNPVSSEQAMESQHTFLGRRYWQSYIESSPHKRLRLPGSRHPMAQAYSGTEPYNEKRRSIPARFLRLIRKEDLVQLDPDTIPVLTKREQRKAEKKEKKRQEKAERRRLEELDELERVEKRKLEQLVEYQRKEWYDRISRQLEVNERERQQQQPEVAKKSLKDKVKNKLKRHSSQQPKDYAIPSSQARLPPSDLDFEWRPPHIDDFQSKGELRSWFGPSDVEAPPPATTIEELPPAELPAIPATSPFCDFSNDVVKKPYDDAFDNDTLLPPLPRSPSPCLSSTLPRRGITMTEIPTMPNSKQMQCDYCHGAIKMTGFHYACIVCDDGDRLYCANCANDGRTCRHQLIERTRNIKRHPTNPQQSERRSPLFAKDSEMSSETSTHVELSACEPEHISTPINSIPLQSQYDHQPSSSGTRRHQREHTAQSPVVDVLPMSAELYREFETKRREQEITFREKEVTLREREAMLREREAWTLSRERDAAMVQQMQAAAMLQQRERAIEVGAQFSPVSPVSRKPSCCWSSPSVSRQSSSKSVPTESITLHSSSKGKKPNVELVDAVAALEASVAGIEVTETNIRSHGNSTKRKASTGNGKSQNGGSSGRKTRSNSQSRKNSNRSNADETEEEEEDEEGGSPKRQKQDQTPDQTGGKIFACPYNKYDSRRYAEGNTAETHYRHCAGGLFRDISRIKQHLKRVHHRPKYHCQRCFEVFKTSNECERHYSDVKGCSARDCPWPEMLDKVQQEQIHTKRPRKDPQEQWFEIFAIIFPGVTPPESPYIEAPEVKSENREILEQFVQLFNNRLNSVLDVPGQTWLQSRSARDFLKLQMQQTVVEMMQMISIGVESTAPDIPSVMVSPVSPPHSEFTSQSRHNSHSSRESSVSHHKRQSSTAPRTPVVRSSSANGPPLRPALKVTTRDINESRGYSSTGVSGTSATSRQNAYTFQNARVPTHVTEDQGYDKSSDSWMSGDDKDAMSTIFQTNEPTSATSTSSRKSVTWASPPSHITSRSSSHQLSSSEGQYHSAHYKPQDMPYLDSMSVWNNQGSFVNDAHDLGPSLKHKSSGRADSGYGTMSHHPSQSSLFHNYETSTDLHHQMVYIDPQMLLMDPAQQNWDTQQQTTGVMSETYLSFGNAGMNF